MPARLAGTGDLPRVGRDGYLVDLAFAADAAPGVMGDVDPQVWLGENAPPGALDALRAAGASVVAPRPSSARRGELGRDASSLALLLSLVAAALAALLAVGTVLATAYVGGRRRSYELAALRSLGRLRGCSCAPGGASSCCSSSPGPSSAPSSGSPPPTRPSTPSRR